MTHKVTDANGEHDMERPRKRSDVRRLEKALKLAIAIIRNDADVRELHQPETAKIRYRWANELEVESGLRDN